MSAEVAVETELLREVRTRTLGVRYFLDGAVDFIAGTAGGIAAVYAGQPLDTVKVKMQSFPHLYKNGFSCLWETFRHGRIKGLYAGSLPALTANIAENSVLFAAYGACQKLIATILAKNGDPKNLHPVESACAGSLASIFAAAVLCPTELVKCRLQTERELFGVNGSRAQKGPFGITKGIIREEGFKGLFRGFTATAVREVPGYFFFFGTYEGSKYMLASHDGTRNDLGVVSTCICGGLAGIAFWVSIFPADVVKSKIQVSGSGSFLETFASVVRESGIAGLYCGLAPTIVRTLFASAALFCAYEAVQRRMRDIFRPLVYSWIQFSYRREELQANHFTAYKNSATMLKSSKTYA
uniref:Mitochondrial ornithine transporter 1 n=1 Tax=Trichuris muris TaxID=70415 RepID=A0A5S6QG06_TRIMR